MEIRAFKGLPFGHNDQRVRAQDSLHLILREIEPRARIRRMFQIKRERALRCAPRASSSAIRTRLGASRISSVLGLNARPQMAKRKPLKSIPRRAVIFFASTSFCAAFTALTACRIRKG